mmetsp:Transcript_17363/g.31623  ORF Transcript_17363/g.31623 Transcript_17363/m.31623 type:complete len:296 (-) Transcript_17363:502-1389(-)
MASTNGGGSSFLVTGALGFVGRHVVEEILAAGHRVVCLCRPSSQGSATADGMVGELAGEFSQPVGRVECDLSDPADVARAVDLAECGTVIHLAALYSWWAPDPAAYQLHNVHVVANLVGAVKEASSKTRRRIKLVQVSTVLAYGRPTGRGLTPETAFEEEDEPGPCLSMYAGSKAEGDRLALASMHSGEIDGCVVYLACCLGRDPKLLDPKRDVMRIKVALLRVWTPGARSLAFITSANLPEPPSSTPLSFRIWSMAKSPPPSRARPFLPMCTWATPRRPSSERHGRRITLARGT